MKQGKFAEHSSPVWLCSRLNSKICPIIHFDLHSRFVPESFDFFQQQRISFVGKMGDNGPNPQAAPFNRAHARFRMDLKKKDQETFRKTTLADLKQCIGEIQDRQHSSRRLQGLNRIQPFLEAVEQFGKVVTIFANSNDVVAFVWVCKKRLSLQERSTNI